MNATELLPIVGAAAGVLLVAVLVLTWLWRRAARSNRQLIAKFDALKVKTADNYEKHFVNCGGAR